MARKPGPGRCVHCLQFFEKRNWDHVFPRSWYPETTAPNLYKWQIPSCKGCNSNYGELEEDLLIRIVLCLNPWGPNTSGLVARALRAIDPAYAKGQGDRRARQAKRDRLRRDLLEGEQIPTEAIYPNFGERWGRPVEQQGAITVPAEGVRKFCEKIVRGIHYLDGGGFIEAPHSVSFYPLHDSDALPIIDEVRRRGQRFAREPGIEVLRVVDQEDGISAFYCITIFDRLKMYASVDRNNV